MGCWINFALSTEIFSRQVSGGGRDRINMKGTISERQACKRGKWPGDLRVERSILNVTDTGERS